MFIFASNRAVKLSLAVTMVVGATICAASPDERPPLYRVERVSPAAPYNSIYPFGVNDKAHFYGLAGVDGVFVWIFWSPELGQVVLKPPRGEVVNVVDINNLDELAVNSTVGPWTWSSTKGWAPLEADVETTTTRLVSRNDRGQSVGVAYNGDGGLFDVSRRSVKWTMMGIVSEFRGYLESVPAAINEHGDVAATGFRSVGFGEGNYEAVLAKHGSGILPLGELPDNGLGKSSMAVALSENGFVAVNSPDLIGDITACYWNERRGLRPIGVGPSTAIGMSRRGTMIGRVTYDGYYFAWDLQWGAINIAEHLTADSVPLVNFTASGISGSGFISGYEDLVTGGSDAVILTPVKAN